MFELVGCVFSACIICNCFYYDILSHFHGSWFYNACAPDLAIGATIQVTAPLHAFFGKSCSLRQPAECVACSFCARLLWASLCFSASLWAFPSLSEPLWANLSPSEPPWTNVSLCLSWPSFQPAASIARQTRSVHARRSWASTEQRSAQKYAAARGKPRGRVGQCR